MNYLYLFLGFLALFFVAGLVYSFLKESLFIKTIGEERSKELGIAHLAIKWLRNPFWFPVVIVVGFLEVSRVLLTTTAAFIRTINQLVRITWAAVTQDHKSAAMCYAYVLSYQSTLTKSDLEKIAVAYDVPMNHLLRISREPEYKTVTAVTKERELLSTLSGKQIDDLYKATGIQDIIQANVLPSPPTE